MTDPATPLYDRPDFFAAYTGMRRQDGRLNEIVEEPALRSLLPDVRGLSVVDLGCGAGAMCRWLVGQGAAQVTGIDASTRMLAEAAALGGGPTYVDRAMEDVALAPASVDLVVSSLALHYVADIAGVTARVASALAPGGTFVFSVEHPVVTCAGREWVVEADQTRAHWPVDRYLDRGHRSVRWLGLDGIPRHHRPVCDYVDAVLDARLVLRRLLEPGPSDEAVDRWPRLADQRRRPPFLLIRADKPS